MIFLIFGPKFISYPAEVFADGADAPVFRDACGAFYTEPRGFFVGDPLILEFLWDDDLGVDFHLPFHAVLVRHGESLHGVVVHSGYGGLPGPSQFGHCVLEEVDEDEAGEIGSEVYPAHY